MTKAQLTLKLSASLPPSPAFYLRRIRHSVVTLCRPSTATAAAMAAGGFESGGPFRQVPLRYLGYSNERKPGRAAKTQRGGEWRCSGRPTHTHTHTHTLTHTEPQCPRQQREREKGKKWTKVEEFLSRSLVCLALPPSPFPPSAAPSPRLPYKEGVLRSQNPAAAAQAEKTKASRDTLTVAPSSSPWPEQRYLSFLTTPTSPKFSGHSIRALLSPLCRDTTGRLA